MSEKGYKTNCAVCGKEFFGRNRQAMYCSDKCRNSGVKTSSSEKKCKCRFCGSLFHSKNRDALFCDTCERIISRMSIEKQLKVNPLLVKKTCVSCGCDYTTMRYNSAYCESPRCSYSKLTADKDMEEIKCIWCGELITEPRKRNSLFCKQQCRNKWVSERKKIFDTAEYKEFAKEFTSKIADLSVEAKANGMSYGQYMAMKYLEQTRIKRKNVACK